MSWAAKRFWQAATVRREPEGWTVLLDQKPVWTPAKRPLLLPTAAMADAIAKEWSLQKEVVAPATMPVTRAANAAIDKVAPQRDDVVAMLSAYAETDLLCYRAESPDALTAREAAAWDPLLDWADRRFGARLVPVAGVMPARQSILALARLRSEVDVLDAFELTAFHDLVTLSGSLVLGLAVLHRRLPPAEAWDASRLDETWQAEQWGRDDEAERAATIRRDAFLAAERFASLNRQNPE